MTVPYRVSPEAADDLDSIWDYIAGRNAPAAERLIKKLQARFALIATQPLMGEACEDLVPGLRRIPVDNYVFYYRPSSGRYRVEIVRVLHGARDIEAIF